jgi:hypothetical protein
VFQQILQGLSASVGRTVTSDELGKAMRRLRHEIGLDNPPLNDPKVVQLLLEFLREMEEEP